MQNWIIPQTTSDQVALTSGLIEAHDAYIEARDRKSMQPYTPQPPAIQQRDATMVILSAARPVAALTLLTSGVVLVGVVVASVGAAIAAFVTTHIVVVGSVGLGLVSLLLVFAGRGESGQVSSAPAGAAPQNITVTVNVAGQNLNTK
jgi:hypothetical protein